MKAAVWHGRGDVRVEDVASAPDPGPGEVRAAVEWCGICGTDLEEWRSGPHFIPSDAPHPLTGTRAPMILGHEVSARIADIGEGVTDLHEGDLVALDGLMGCGECWWCARHMINLCPKMASIGLHVNGGLAETITVQAATCIAVPAGVGADSAALAEPFAVAVRALRRARLSFGESVAIFGGGMIGLATTVVAKAAGAAPIVMVEPLAERRALALQCGADHAFDPREAEVLDEIVSHTQGRGADVSVDAAGKPAVGPLAVRATRSGGRTAIVGLTWEPSSFSFFTLAAGEKEIIGSLSHVADEDFAAAVSLIAARGITPELVSAMKVPLERAVDDGFASLAGAHPPAKVLVGGRV